MANSAIQGQFTELVLSPGGSIMWHTIFMALTIAIVIGGIQKGIERWSKILMPIKERWFSGVERF